jgi:hypothetical protein
MRTDIVNKATSKLIIILAMALISCGDHSLEELLGDSSSSGRNNLSSSSSYSSSSSSRNKQSSSSKYIEIDDENIEPAASFASDSLGFISFPFKEMGDWISYFSIEDLNWYINVIDNDDGEAFRSIFELLSEKRNEYLSNGKFKRYIELIANLIPRRAYVANGWDTMVRQLLVAYEDLAANPDNFSEVYNIMQANGSISNNATEAYWQILDFVSDQELEEFILERDVDYYYSWEAIRGNVNRSAVVWAYSFWGRRYNENPSNLEPIVEILLMLLNKYS